MRIANASIALALLLMTGASSPNWAAEKLVKASLCIGEQAVGFAPEERGHRAAISCSVTPPSPTNSQRRGAWCSNAGGVLTTGSVLLREYLARGRKHDCAWARDCADE